MMPSTDEIINYFVNQKFGLFAAFTAGIAALNKNQNSSTFIPNNFVEIENYKKYLQSITPDELEKSYKLALAKDKEQKQQNMVNEENSRFYNLASSNADFVHWAKAAHWTLDEAIALSFGKEPEQVNWAKIEPLKNKTTFAKDYAKRRDLALRATRWKKFGDTIPPIIFVSWAEEVKIDLPSALVAELENVGCTATNWREQYQKIKLALDALEHKKPENTQKAENLLKAIACVAIDAYGYDQNSAKSTAPKDIAEALKRHGITLDPKTIRGWLKDGSELLPRKPA